MSRAVTKFTLIIISSGESHNDLRKQTDLLGGLSVMFSVLRLMCSQGMCPDWNSSEEEMAKFMYFSPAPFVSAAGV